MRAFLEIINSFLSRCRFWIGKIIFLLTIVPISFLLYKLICPEATQRPMEIWLDERKEKVRFLIYSCPFANNKRNSAGMKIKDWLNVVDYINEELRKK